MNNAKDFLNDLKEDKALAEALEKAISEAACTSKEEALEATVRFAAEKGYAFEPEELTLAEAADREVSDEELDAVASGAGIFCWWDYSCYVTMHHDQNSCKVDSACFADHKCVEIVYYA